MDPDRPHRGPDRAPCDSGIRDQSRLVQHSGGSNPPDGLAVPPGGLGLLLAEGCGARMEP